MKSRLLLLPISPYGLGGYNKAVLQDLERLSITDGDQIVIYDTEAKGGAENFVFLPRPVSHSFSRLLNLAKLDVSTAVSPCALKNVIDTTRVEEIFCGDVVFYKAVKALFPKHPVTVRFHNLFSLVYTRNRYRKLPIHLALKVNLFLYHRLESRILEDSLVTPIFINPVEKTLFDLLYPKKNAHVWSPSQVSQLIAEPPKKSNFIYFGSHAHHQTPGIKYFLDRIFKPLRKKYPLVQMHFWGKSGKKYHKPKAGIFYNGDYHGTNLPMLGDGLYINPDLLGGGIKYKIHDWLSKGAAFISTPYGVEGYMFEKSDNIIVADIESWLTILEKYISVNGLVYHSRS